jgi:hypothetical protein
MALNDIHLGVSGSEALLTPFGRSFGEGMQEISREERTASGRLVRDITATKRKFTIEYDLISHTDLESIAGLYNLQGELSLKITRPTGAVNTYTVLLKPFDRKRVASYGCGYWSGVTLDMEEV